MNPEQNPLLQTEDPYANVKTVQNAATDAQMEFQRLCWELFHQDLRGKKFIELLKERYLMRPLFTPDHPQGSNQAMFWEGFREAVRSFYNYGLQHQQYINGVTNSGSASTIPGSPAASITAAG